MRRYGAVLLLLLGAACCVRNTRAPTPLLKAEGEAVTVRPGGGEAVAGELIAVETDRLVLLVGGRLAVVPVQSVRRVEVAGYPALALPEQGKYLRQYARYPRGLLPEQWRLLLGDLGQEDFDSLSGGGP